MYGREQRVPGSPGKVVLHTQGDTTMGTTTTPTLERLSQSDLILRDPADDIRDRSVYDASGDEIGTVRDLLVDREEARVRFIRLGSGGVLGIGEETYLIPVDAITDIDDDGVHIDRRAEHVRGGPVYQPELMEDPAAYGSVYEWYGYAPYWTGGYVYPPYGARAR